MEYEDRGLDIFEIFAQFQTIAPKNIDEMREFETACRREGHNSLAEWIYNWIMNIEYHKMREWDEDIGNKNSVSGASEGR